jgi:hypothetical protein
MADQIEPPGRLISIEGSRGKDTAAAAADVIEALKDAGVESAISRFDASGLFGELATAAQGDRQISIRTLTLVYAADLAFRLRWEIRPVLDAGGVVIAAPYLETAVAFGVSCGLSEEWIRELLRFAPKPDLHARAEERKLDRGWKRRFDRGYPEYCAAMLKSSAPKLASKRARRDAMALLDRPKGRAVVHLSEKGVTNLVKAVTGSRRAMPSGSRGRARNGRR